MKRLFACIMLLSCSLFVIPVYGNQPETVVTSAAPALDLSAKSAVVMEAGSGTILYEKEKDKELPPASVTKVMSLLLIFQEIDSGKLKLSDKVTVSEHAASMGGSQVFLEPSEVQDVETLIKCVVVSSANDAVVALAEHIAGSEDAFVKRMNQEAKKLGMKHTTFKNACGLDADGHVTTAYDIALMSRELTTKHPNIFKYTKIWMDSFTHETKKGTTEFELSNTNKMIKQYNGCTGLKTGSTSTAKFCLSATATRNGIDLIAVVMASDDSKTRIKDASALLDYGFSNCQVTEDVTTSKEIGKIPVEKGKKETVSYPEKINTKITRIKSDGGKLKKEIKIKTVKAPVKKGQSVGKIIYKDGNKIAAETEIKASENIGKMDYLSSLRRVAGEYF
ncbi:MAG TPA: D-alanyl-D-alanine carboxypeptidase [Candidatus Anaerostipes excrementavium]|uniref:serine-type D-Ala-D-Ala carboxypeptidase n=1 Tax=Candidatus Anaerostipes excrementavium TaxID=2838463 RepID=A0A9D1WVW8_9FIRM|nr:D-alanyl-D-alanine carboxypeptidase family protein [uncultured Anaerostipes sp.]HIX67816.1 D-alanyl-D-alanine carboxypeptidase [Candidatus Anaerostipes excrementavium]